MGVPAFVPAFVLAVLAATPLAGQGPAGQPAVNQLILSGDLSLFVGPGKPDNCILKSRYKVGEPVGFRMTAIDPVTGKRERSAQLVVHLTYAGKSVDIPMRDFQTEKNPEREFWVAKWVVPADATPGIVRYSVTARDKHGRTGEWRPFPIDDALLTIVP